ncbi:hypothetical protein PG1C_10505 [Rugosibacter aromaticivorans]|uniref:UPF0102 protein PG1C_10505 n=1 Tax=Rugosibacter aromaticivorans TaxID=1565605 RepID=A0A0C5J0Y4_9PROT|nr:YraN family protein [Rugosibacter aromaticivorans]AJP48752.1 hypothetical protein PG1C_10505 [Rugosibacter aromaticivorans]TBR13514.1 MAG: YraN family protein [Rugosibacter sp.]
MTSQQKTGTAGETAAADYLERQGLTVLERNFRVRGGELDLICRAGDVIVFVEVRLRNHKGYGGAAASITVTKQHRLILAAQHWLTRRHQHDAPCRFDCVVIDDGHLEWIRDAFTAD